VTLATSWGDPIAVAGLAAAGGTLFLGFVTVWLVTVTKRSVAKTAEAVKLEQEQMARAQEPRVFPTAPAAWTEGAEPYAGRWHEVLPVENGGPGVALNVRGELTFHLQGGDVAVSLVPTNLAPGDKVDMRINWQGAREPVTDWTSVHGQLYYEDISGARWTTDFTVNIEGRRFVNVQRSGMVMRADGTVVVTEPG